MKKIFLITILAILAMAAVIHAQPQLLTYPLTLESMSDTVTVTWSDPGVTCEMIYGTSPRVYTASPIQQSGQGALSFVPGSIAGMTGGVYYCRISETAGSMSTTQEFQLYVENTNAPHLIQPGAATLTGTAINTLSPNFQWNSVNGVPFDTVMLSDEPVQIQVPSSGSGNNITITSDPIWLVTTNQTNITYPTPDPSGYYNQMQPPPLMQGLTYSWCAFNNYTGTPSMVSDAFAGTYQFTVNLTAACAAPTLVSPTDGLTITAGSTIDLTWNDVANANSYMVFLSSNETDTQEVGGLSRIPRWNTIVSSSCNNVTVPADVGLNDRWYSWYVIALDSQGMGAKSQEQSFYYDITTTGVDIHVSSIINPALPNSNVTIPQAVVFMQTLSGGNVNIYPIITDDSGQLSYDLPGGTYSFSVQRIGYDSTSVSNIVIPNSATYTTYDVYVYLTPSAYTVSGSVTDNSSQPLQGVQITASQSGMSYQTSTLGNGSFELNVSGTGIWNIQAVKAGYAPAVASANVLATGNTVAAPSPIIMVKDLNTLSGTVTNPSSQGIYNALVSIYQSGNPANSYSLNTDANGNYTISLPDGTWIVNVTKAGFVPPPQASIPLSNGSSVIQNFTMAVMADQISGNVTFNGSALPGVVVSATSVSGTVTTTTDAFGNYSLSVANGFNYTVNSFAGGYASNGAQIINLTATTAGYQQTGVNFVMSSTGIQNNSSLYVQVTSSAYPLGLQGVNISVQGPGYAPANAVTDVYGGVTFYAMPTGIFGITLTDVNYQSIATGVTITVPNATTSYEFGMLVDSSAPGTISGTVLNGANPAQGVMISIYPQGSTFTSVPVAFTAANGTYSVPAIEGNYVVQPVINNFIISPAQAYVSLAPLGTAIANFTLTQPQGGGVTVSAPSTIIYNENLTGPYVFTANYTAGNGAPVPVNFVWSVVPAAAGAIVGTASNVTFVPTTDYLGQATIVASALGQSSGATVSVWQKLTVSPVWPTAAKTVKDYQGFSLNLPLGCASSSNTIGQITLNTEAPSSQRAMTKNGMVVGSIYDLTNGFLFSTPANLTLPIPSNYSSSSAQIAAWNTANLNWQDVSSSNVSNGSVTGAISSLCEYAAIIPLQPLGFASVTMLPNPFSPYRGGLNINYILESKEGSQVITTIKIYNMAGRLIRTLLDRQEKGVGIINTQVWDGKDKDGQIGANGRYILQIEIEDASGKKQGLYSIVLIK